MFISNIHCFKEQSFFVRSELAKCFFAPQVEPSTKLFPAVFAKATSPNVFQFEFGRMKVRRAQLIFTVLAHFFPHKMQHNNASKIHCNNEFGFDSTVEKHGSSGKWSVFHLWRRCGRYNILHLLGSNSNKKRSHCYLLSCCHER